MKRPKILAVVSTKGGTGKSTISFNLGACAVNDGKSVLVIDADTQGTSVKFGAIRNKAEGVKPMAVASHTTDDLFQVLKNAQREEDLIIIDAGGQDSRTMRAAMMAADVILIPILPGGSDVIAVQYNTMPLVKQLVEVRPNVTVRFVVNQLNPHTRVAKAVVDLISKLAEEIRPTKAVLQHRVIYGESTMSGKSVAEYNPESKAATEMAALYSEVHDLLNLESHTTN